MRRRSPLSTALFRPGHCSPKHSRFCGSKVRKVVPTALEAVGFGWLLSLAVGLLGAFSGNPALAGVERGVPVNLASHEAVYELSLLRAEPGGLISFNGQLQYTIENVCTGWTNNWKMITILRNQDGLQVDTRWEFTSYESFDGTQYLFYGRTIQNDQTSEVIEGSANRPAKAGRPFAAIFTAPRSLTLPLPPGTSFPNAHTISLINAARAGHSFASGKLFDGGNLSGAALVTSAIGTRFDATQSSALDNPLLKTPSWRFSMAYFSEPEEGEPVNQALETPTYEVQGRMHENGVTQDMVQDFGTFSVRARLTSLKALPTVDCGRPKP